MAACRAIVASLLLLAGVSCRAKAAEAADWGPALPAPLVFPLPEQGDSVHGSTGGLGAMDPSAGLLASPERVPAPGPETRGTAPVAAPNGPESLEQGWAVALAFDRSLEAKRFGTAAATETLLSARAERWPSVAVEGSYAVRDNEQAFRSYAVGLPIPGNLRFPFLQEEGFAFRTRIDLPLYTGGEVGQRISAAQAGVATAERDVAFARSELMVRVAQEYVAVLRAEQYLDVADCRVHSLEARLGDVQTLCAHQRATSNDLLAAQAAVSEARQAALEARNLLDLSRAAYNRRLGRPLTYPVWLASVSVPPLADDLPTLTARAVSGHPSLGKLRAQIEALERQAAAELAKNGLRVNAWGDYAFEENRYVDPEGIAEVGLGVSWNIFDGGRDRHCAAAILHEAAALRSTRADLESLIALEVRRAWLEVHQTARRIEAAGEAMRRAEENLRVAQRRHAVAVGTNTEVLDAQLLQSQSRHEHAGAVCDAVLAAVRLRHATGELGR